MSLKRCIKLYIVTFLLTFQLACVACKKANEQVLSHEKLEIAKKIQYFLFEDLSYDKKVFYYPLSLLNFIEKTYYSFGGQFYLLELANPSYIGFFDTIKNYDSTQDSFDWVETTLLQLEEERIAQELLKMENELALPQIEDSYDDSNSPEKLYLNMDNTLAVMESGKEILVPQKNGDDYILICTDGPKVKRSFYDNALRLYKIQNWDIKSIDNVTLMSTYDYFYKDNSTKPCQKNYTDNSSIQKNYYNNQYLLEKTENFQIYKENNYIESEIFYTYTSDNQIKKIEQIEYLYENNNFSDLQEKFTRTTEYYYVHDNQDIPANYNYYENGIIKMKNTYTEEKGTYTSRIYFDESYSVETHYQNDKKIKEIFLMNDTIRRVKEYE